MASSEQQFTGPDGEPWIPPTTEELLARGAAAVKKQYLRPLRPIPAAAPAAAPAEPAAPEDGGNGATTAGGNGTTAGVRGSEHGVDKNRTGKSRRQQQREKQAARQSGGELCTAFVKGICNYPNCKFSHDVDLYINAKQADLPGTCPFIAGGKSHCPHGLMCRYFGSHPAPAPAPASDAADAGDAAAEGDKSVNQLKPHVSYEIAAAMAAKRLTTERDGVLELPVPKGDVLDEVNTFPGDLKLRLRKGKVRFEKADALLAELGVKTSWRYSSNDGSGGGGGRKKKGENKSDADWGEDSVEVGSGSSGEGRGGKEEGGGKRRKAQDGSGIAAAAADDADNKAEGTDVKLRFEEKKLIDFRGKLYLAPLTTTGNLPFRRVCKGYGVDITCGEMAMCTNLLQGHAAEWALLRRHPCEDIFGVQVCGGYSDSVSRCAQLLEDEVASKGGIDFVDINMGCPIDLVCNKGAGSMLLERPARMEQIVRASAPLLSCPLTLKTRMGYFDNRKVAHDIIPKMKEWGLAAMTLHGRSRQQRYSRLADWAYVKECADNSPIPLIGNGDIFSYHDYAQNVENSGVATCMIARGALIKPWVFTEIKEKRDWDISATERLDMLKEFCAFGLEHWVRNIGGAGRGEGVM